MAIIHGKSQSTQYILNRISEINGKKLNNLLDIKNFYNNYNEILSQTEKSITLQQDEKISNFFIEEMKLTEQIQKGISLCTIEVDAKIKELNDKSRTSPSVFQRFNYKINYWFQVYFRSNNIETPFKTSKQKLNDIQKNKRLMIEQKPQVIDQACKKVTYSYNVITENKTFLIGAEAEEEVIEYLSQLPDNYHILNDVKLQFYKAIHWKEYNDYIKTSQIDHIVIGPTGIFLLETKNWKVSDLDVKSDQLIRQVRRQSLALWYFLKDHYKGEPKIWNLSFQCMELIKNGCL